jgi:hypothetical protein
MDAKKKAEFVRAMGKKRLKFAKGGAVRRKRFADGGTALNGPTDSGTHQNASNPNTGVLGTIGGALGLNNNFQASGASIQAGTNNEQLNQAYTGAQNAIGAQSNLTNQLTPGVNTAVQNQNALANQYLAMTQGQGPNPALAQLNQTTQQNINNQAALMAGQRGASANAGLIARQAAQQGAATQQQAAGQAATMEAQQQIAAQQNLQNLAASQVSQAGQAVSGLNSAQQNEQNILQSANTAANNANVGMQSSINSANAQTAASNQGMAGNILGGVVSGVSSLVGGLFAEGGKVDEHHLKLAEMNAHSLNHAQKFADGGMAFNPVAQSSGPVLAPAPVLAAPQGNFMASPLAKDVGKAFEGLKDRPREQSDEDARQGYLTADADLGVSGVDNPEDMLGADNLDQQMPDSEGAFMAAHGGMAFSPGHFERYFADGGEVPAMVSAGEVYLNPDQVHRVLKEDVDPKDIGHKFKGKAKVKGDSYKNDTIPTTLREGGVVIDREHMGSAEKRKLFVHQAMAKKKAGGKL